MKSITIKGARVHNLKNISLDIPKDKLVVITGLSGSGKSSLAFDTIYAEGQRRYVESLSAYARQFLGLMDKPDVDAIEGLSPAISIEQKTTSNNPRSTVGTVTEIYDYLRLLFGRVGVPHDPKTGEPIMTQTADQITEKILEKYKGTAIYLLAPAIKQKKGTHEKLVEGFSKDGFVRCRINKELQDTNEKPTLERYKKHDIEIVIDRFTVDSRTRVQEAVELALQKSMNSSLIVVTKDEIKKEAKAKEEIFTTNATSASGITFDEISPRLFSFNSPLGACLTCHGLGFTQEFDEDLIVPDKSLSIADGAIKAFSNHMDGWRMQQLGGVAKHFGIDVFKPYGSLTKEQQKIILHGSDEAVSYAITSKSSGASYRGRKEWEGVVPMLERLYHQTESDYRRNELQKFMRQHTCPTCHGTRLQKKVLYILVAGKNIKDVTSMPISEARQWFNNVELDKEQAFIAKQVLKEIQSRLGFLDDVGLGYLTLDRSAGTLSGGEAQRIRLATQIGSQLTGVLYILDEPSIGLHQRDNDKLIQTLKHLRDIGNTVIVVEHDEDTMMEADHLIDIGPGAGVHGGNIIAAGTPQEVMKNKKSLTGQYLAGKEHIATPTKRREPQAWIELKGAQENNLKNVNVKFPTGIFSCVTGVSGSGKSTLVTEILLKALKKEFTASKELPGKHKSITIPKEIENVIVIDQSPIGRTPRSNPATYTKVFDDIRKLFAATKDAKMRGYKVGRFSFNVKGGRCETCQGDGVKKIEMNFLPDVYVTCEACKGTRYNKETLEVRYKGKNIAEVLDMDVEEALEFFKNVPGIDRKIQTLADVGLTYIKLGQSSTTLSGGEAQRIKLTRELAKRSLGKTLYVLDEPTTGLHFHDVKKLLDVLERLVKKKNSILVIEHNLDVIKTADYIIDLGPEGGAAGGQIIATGTPEEIAKNKKSHTGTFLAKVLKKK